MVDEKNKEKAGPDRQQQGSTTPEVGETELYLGAGTGSVEPAGPIGFDGEMQAAAVLCTVQEQKSDRG